MIPRRRLLGLLCLPARLPTVFGVQAAMAAFPGALPPWVRLVMHFDHFDDLAALGAVCLRERPAAWTSDAATIYRALTSWVGIPNGRPGKVLAALPGRIAVDFESGAMESVDGWQLSRTEVLLALLAAKSRPHL